MIYDKLYKWQQEIVDKFKKRYSFGLFLDMGTGKTPISCAFAEQNLCTKVLIITINSKAIEDVSVDGSWLNWISQSNINYKLYNKSSTEFKSDIPECMIVNYESLFKKKTKKEKSEENIKNKQSKVELKENISNFIDSCKGHSVALIIDESHKVKNLHSMQTSAILKIQKLLNFRSNLYTYLLTGTPFTNGYEDLYVQLKMLGYENSKSSFIDNFCVRGNVPGLLGWQQPIIGYKNLDRLYKLVHSYAITMKSSDVIDLPEQIFVYHKSNYSIHFDMFTHEVMSQKDLLKYAKQRHTQILNLKDSKTKINNPFYSNINYPELDWIAETNGSFWLRARQLSIGFNGNAEKSKWFDRTRLNDLEEFLKNNEDNYLLFYNYTPELLEIYDICDKLGYNIDVYCGEMKSLVFYEKYCSQTEEQQLTNKRNIILANFASGSTGINWQKYNKCIIFSMPLYKDYEQGIKRIHRIGQKNTVVYHIFMQNNWLDKSMKKALDDKIQYSNDMFENDLKKEENND